MSKTKSRAKQFEDWEEKPAKDYDPEDAPATDNEDSGSDASVDENAGTEHYAPVGKSKLRRKQDVKLGPAYRGTRVTRDALEQSSESEEDYEDALEDLLNGNEDDDSEEDDSDGEEFVDPDEADLERDQKEQGGEDAEIDSDDAFGETDEEKFSKLGYTFLGSSQPMPVKGKRVARPTAADFLDDEAELSEDGEGLEGEEDDDDEEDEDDEEEDSDDDMDGFIDDGQSEDDEGEEDDDDEDSDESAEEAPKKPSKLEKDFAKLAMKVDGKSGVTGSLVDSLQKDVAKGLAVRQQRKAFDAALNIRIRLQKAIVASNTIPTVESSDDQNEPYEAAEAAAIKLWNAIDAFRTDMQPGAGQKRKRTIDTDDSSQDIWDKMQDIETKGHIRRKNVLQNWDDKVKKARMDPAAQHGFRNKQSKGQQSLTAWLEQKMQDPEGTERLVKRTRTPRSCAPAQVARKVTEDPDIYDDADFYQLLLKELVDQRTADASATTTGPTATLRYAAVKEAKTKKNVDTKASKGRKMRFNVHEKLQLFMAPEDRRQWEPSAIDRLFGTLFGQQVENVLDEDAVSEDEEMGGVTAEEAGLMLFRN
ncbi:rRNA-processing protein BFR2 [Apiospora saccharicola]